MPKRISTPKLDDVQNARRVVLASLIGEAAALTDTALISRIMAEMGRKGGRIGGKRRLVTLSDKRRRDIAVAAAKARWAKRKKTKKARGDNDN
jgi:hypothetical protein